MGQPFRDPPKVSIVIPTFNAAVWVEETLRSVVGQTETSWELIVVDDGSSDETLSILQHWRERISLRLIHQKNAGPSIARNAGARTASGEWLLFLDADDRLHPRFLAETLQAGQTRQDVGVVGTGVRCFGMRNDEFLTPAPTLLSLLERNSMVVTSLVRRIAFEGVGGFDESMREGYEDWDLWIRLAQRGWHFARVPQLLFEYRIRAESHNQGVGDPFYVHWKRLCFLHLKHRALYEENFPSYTGGFSVREYVKKRWLLKLRHQWLLHLPADVSWPLTELLKEGSRTSLLPR